MTKSSHLASHFLIQRSGKLVSKRSGKLDSKGLENLFPESGNLVPKPAPAAGQEARVPTRGYPSLQRVGPAPRRHLEKAQKATQAPLCAAGTKVLRRRRRHPKPAQPRPALREAGLHLRESTAGELLYHFQVIVAPWFWQKRSRGHRTSDCRSGVMLLRGPPPPSSLAAPPRPPSRCPSWPPAGVLVASLLSSPGQPARAVLVVLVARIHRTHLRLG